jgi:hypothetical protein
MWQLSVGASDRTSLAICYLWSELHLQHNTDYRVSQKKVLNFDYVQLFPLRMNPLVDGKIRYQNMWLMK